MYTKEEKKRLVELLRARTERRIAALQSKYEALAQELEGKITRRLNNVSAALWNVKMKDILAVERQQKPSIRLLLADLNNRRDPELRRSYHIDRKRSPKRVVSSHK